MSTVNASVSSISSTYNYYKNDYQDQTKLLTIFPAEVWLLILNLFQDADDIRSLSGVSPLLNNLLQPTKPEKLFPAVWDVLGPILHKNPSWLDIDTGETDRRAQIRRFINRRKTLLSLRLVKKSWSDAIDHFYYTHTLASKTVDKNADKLFTNPVPLLFPWGSFIYAYKQSFFYNDRRTTDPYIIRANIKKFLMNFDLTHPPTNLGSFIAKHVHLIIPHEERFAEFYQFDQDVCLMLSKYGAHIQICEFHFLDKYITPRKYIKLQKWLSALPNLVCLEIKFGNFTFSSVFPSLMLLERTPLSMIPQLRSLTVNTPIPKLEKLKHINVFYVTPLVLNLILETNSHVTHLRFNPGSCHEEELAIHTVPLPNLQLLEIAYPRNSTADFLRLETAVFGKEFSSLSVYFEKWVPPLREMFTVWGNKWGNSLTHLKFYAVPLKRHEGFEKEREQVVQELNILQKTFLPAVKRLQLYNGS